MAVRWVCVFCGSRVGANPVYAEAARQFGAALAAGGLGLVYGGGAVGLMGVVADAALAAGGRVVGVLPRRLSAREIAHAGLTELHIVETMHQRKALMADRADAFAALPGAFGTCDELFEILTWAQLGLHRKPVGLLNVAGYFDPLLAWVSHMRREGFLWPEHAGMLLVEREIDALLRRLQGWTPAGPAPEKWLEPGDR
jgi:uncharacterized protein (TIGR00730 family)